MASEHWCPECGAFRFGKSHKCPPIWTVWCPEWHGDDPDDAVEVRAIDADGAAEKWADEHDHERDLLRSAVEVRVRQGADDEWQVLRVEGEATVEYRAWAMKP